MEQLTPTKGTTHQLRGATMPATAVIHPSLRELARRVGNAVEVTLYWHERSGALVVTVLDRNSGAYVQFAAEHEKALYAFYHPYAYAAATEVTERNAFAGS
jgi:hypothetical protein